MDSAGLEDIPLFADLTDEQRAQVASAMREVTGELIRTLGPGDVLGEIGVLATGTRTASVVATSPIRLRAMFIRQFKDLERDMPQLASSLRDGMSQRPWSR